MFLEGDTFLHHHIQNSYPRPNNRTENSTTCCIHCRVRLLIKAEIITAEILCYGNLNCKTYKYNNYVFKRTNVSLINC